METERDAIIEKVQKILAKVGRGATEAETQTALAMARRLLAEHQITMADVEREADAWSEDHLFLGARSPQETDHVVPILERHFFVRIFRVRMPRFGVGLTFFGDPAAVELASWLYARLVDQYRALFRAYRAKTRRPVGDRVGYYFGLSEGLDDRLMQARQPAGTDGPVGGNALALASLEERIDDAFFFAHPEVKAIGGSSVLVPNAALAAGREDASKLALNRPIESRGTSTLALPSPDRLR